MYENPITLNVADISSQIRKAQDGRLIYEVQQAIGYEINKEELIKALKYDRDQYQKGYEDGRNDNEWIPVSERLPEEGEEVLVWYEYFRYGNYNGMWPAYGIGWQYDNHFSVDNGGAKQRVIAWQPLPKPYKTESEG